MYKMCGPNRLTPWIWILKLGVMNIDLHQSRLLWRFHIIEFVIPLQGEVPKRSLNLSITCNYTLITDLTLCKTQNFVNFFLNRSKTTWIFSKINNNNRGKITFWKCQLLLKLTHLTLCDFCVKMSWFPRIKFIHLRFP